MALSLLYNPGDYFSAHGDLIFTILEDTKPFNSSLYTDYKYVCDLYIYGFQQARLKAFPRPDDKIGYFNIGNIVRNYLYTNFTPGAGLRAQKLGENYFYTNAICRFGEEYGGVTYTNIIVDSQRSYYNQYNGRLFGTATSLPNYIDKVMSDRPAATEVSRNANYLFVPFLASDDTTINLIIKSYRGGAMIGSTTQPFTPTAASTNEQQLFNVAPGAINSVVPGFINNGIDYYTVEFNTTNITGDSLLQFNLVCEPRYETYTVHFMNKLGGFESKDFNKVSRRKVEIQKSTYGANAFLINSSGQPEYYNSSNVYRETKKTYAGSWTESMTLNSDLLPDAEYRWLEQLVLSPICYIEIEGFFFPMSITDNNYEPKKYINDDLTNLTINIEFGDRFNTQFR